MPPFMQGQAPSYAARWAALRNLGPFFRLVWRANPGLTLLMVSLRLARAVMPVTMLWVGKLIIDEVVRLIGIDAPPGLLAEWWQSGLLEHLSLLVLAELALALVSDLLDAGSIIPTR